MRALRIAIVVVCCLLTGATTAVAGDSPAKVGGWFTYAANPGSGSVEFACFEALGEPGTPGYKPATGKLTMTSDNPFYNFTMTMEDVDIDAQGFALMSGRDAQGFKWVVLAVDGGTPGAGNDTFWTMRYDSNDAFVEVIGWNLTGGNLKIRAGS